MSSKGASSLRRVYSGCKQELSRSAYYRHQNYPASCPAGTRTVADRTTVRSGSLAEFVNGGKDGCATTVDSDLFSSSCTHEAQSSDQPHFEDCKDCAVDTVDTVQLTLTLLTPCAVDTHDNLFNLHC